MNRQDLSGTAYSYLRFSSKRQEQGDSIRRQTAARDAWLARNPGVKLAPDEVYADLGTSAFRGRHRAGDKAALAQFLRAVEGGRVKAGSFLIVESLDRLTREELGEAVELVLGLVNRGVRIVQLSPAESILGKPVDMTALVLAVVELSRGRGESQRKSDMLIPAWQQKRDRCREDKEPITKCCKAWLDVVDGKFQFKPGAKELIRRIFAMATAGHGCRVIAKKFNEEKVPPWVKGSAWHDVFVRRILRGREVLGEFQPHHWVQGKDGMERVPDGEAIVGYYPAAVTEAEWLAADVARKSRKRKGGRPSPHGVNIFRGLLWDARSGDTINIVTPHTPQRRLQPKVCKTRGVPSVSFPLEVFEEQLLDRLDELKLRDVIGSEQDGPNDVDELKAKLERIDAQLAGMAEEFDNPDDIPAVAAKMRAKNAERKRTVEELDKAEAKAASPLSAAWGECKGLLEVMRKTKDQAEFRVRLRAGLQRIVESITAMFVARDAMLRLAAVRVQFVSGTHRSYLIVHQHGNGKTQHSTATKSFAEYGLPTDADLRDPKAAARLEALITKHLANLTPR